MSANRFKTNILLGNDQEFSYAIRLSCLTQLLPRT